jgi:hypothetical protein
MRTILLFLFLVGLTACDFQNDRPESQIDRPLRVHFGILTLSGRFPEAPAPRFSLISTTYIANGAILYRHLSFGNRTPGDGKAFQLLLDTKSNTSTFCTDTGSSHDRGIPESAIQEFFKEGSEIVSSNSDRLPEIQGLDSDEFRTIAGIFGPYLPHDKTKLRGVLIGLRAFPTEESMEDYYEAERRKWRLPLPP